MKHIIEISAICSIGIVACSEYRGERNLVDLTGNSGIKYWDVVYSSDIYNRPQNPFSKSGLPNYCIKLERSGRVTHYNYLDSLRIIDRGCNTDVVFNPDSFTFESDSTLRFGGRKYSITFLSKEFMILKFGPDRINRATVIYSASKAQTKEIVRCK
ncbi:MAG TPA: hypothetical protein VF690_10495 [Hymenobacter sp.]